jgi:hypothetical protein
MAVVTVTFARAHPPRRMGLSYKTTEQYERWHVRDCVRCGRGAANAANWA